ncbi:methionyl tRNA formyltransferase [Legionella quinlivanii]|uniref:Methionyl-tRNA formyltransferase n=1 Tax=Legionella quinlivanii TaxID=45073 RepID=A0A0W0Y6I5_9GAMM|nr:methionyl-tRNA formyltransferase [Legionella quinlivanii]KTD52561.1 methionyl tRNA formyltransferase [Legionella quinlivanii]SEF70666.1 methionyl-tRNA formyltransferase [Legionella quinlivanii DSM 21216]STY12110.1 methionyl-tRNA formyltransferase [Legionella quinlivanii]
MTSSLSIVFAGTPEFGVPCLDALARSGHRLLAVYSQPDRPAGRGRKLQASAVKTWALENQYPVYQPLNFKSESAVAELAALKPDVMVVIAYGLILPARVLAIPRLGCINVHASLLPRWRGASPIQQAILHGDPRTGVTIMQMDAGMDTGAKLMSVDCAIDAQDTAGSLHDKLSLLSIAPLLETLNLLAQDMINPEAQSAEGVTYAGKIQKEQALIDWQLDADVIERQIRAFNPWPISYTSTANGEMIKIYQAKVETELSNAAPGTVLSVSKEGLCIATGRGVLSVQQLQFAGGKPLSITEWMNAGKYHSLIGQVLNETK